MNLPDPEFLSLLCDSASRADLWCKMIANCEVRTMLEVGVWRGEFAREILRRCDAIQKYYMADPWSNLHDWNKPFNVSPAEFEKTYAEAMQNTEFAASRRVVLKGRTKEVVNEIPDGSLDFAYIDGDHTLRGITIDLIKILPKIKEGGFIGGDDFENSPWQHNVWFEPTLVCPFSVYFAEAMNLPIVALPFSQFILQKSTKADFSFTDTTGRYSDISLNKLPPGVIKIAIKRKLKRLLEKLRG